MKKKIVIISILVVLVGGAIIYLVTRPSSPEVYRVCGVGANQINEFSLDTNKKFQIVYYYPWKWSQNKLRVYFEDILDENLRERVLDIANVWKPHTGIEFVPGSSPYDSEIRVAFRKRNGYQSLIGSKADSAKLLRHSLLTTMWLQDLDTRPQKEFHRVVLHEFGHALGLLHELQSIKSPIRWDSNAVYKYFDAEYKWRRPKVNEQILTPASYASATTFDPESIMIYAIPSFLMKNHPDIPWPSGLSKDDKLKIKLVYP